MREAVGSPTLRPESVVRHDLAVRALTEQFERVRVDGLVQRLDVADGEAELPPWLSDAARRDGQK